MQIPGDARHQPRTGRQQTVEGGGKYTWPECTSPAPAQEPNANWTKAKKETAHQVVRPAFTQVGELRHNCYGKVQQRRVSVLKGYATIPIGEPFPCAVDRGETVLADIAGESEVCPFDRLTSVGVLDTEPFGDYPEVQPCQYGKCNCSANGLAPGGVNLNQGRFLL